MKRLTLTVLNNRLTILNTKLLTATNKGNIIKLAKISKGICKVNIQILKEVRNLSKASV